MDFKTVFATQNRCFKANVKMKPIGIVVHSTGANNPNLRRYVAPNDGRLGTPSSEHWNQSKTNVCVHAFIGKLANGNVATYQTLPFDVQCWGCGSGSKGSYNRSHIQFEICEDGLTDSNYFNAVYKEAVEFCAYLCKTYGIPVSSITTHCDAHKAGYASNHADVMHWFPRHGKDMDIFRSDVQKLVNGESVPTPTQSSTPQSSGGLKLGLYRIISEDGMNIRSGPGTNYGIVGTVSKGEAFTIIQFSGDWGKLKSGKGWINCNPKYCQFVSGNGQATNGTSQSSEFTIKVTEPTGLTIRKGPGVSYAKRGAIPCGPTKYTIVEVDGDWGLLKSYAKNRDGWICLTGYTERC